MSKITRKRVGNAGVVIVVGENGQSISTYNGEGKEISSIWLDSYSPEDHTFARLGMLEFIEKTHEAACDEGLPVNGAFDQAKHYIVDDGQDTLDSEDILIPIKYLVSDEVILYADTKGYSTPFAVDFGIDEDPVDVFNQHMQSSGYLSEDERYTEVEQ